MVNEVLEVSYLNISVLKVKKLSKHRKEMQEEKVRVWVSGETKAEGPPQGPIHVLGKGHTFHCPC